MASGDASGGACFATDRASAMLNRSTDTSHRAAFARMYRRDARAASSVLCEHG